MSVEFKDWLDLLDQTARAKLAKAAIALANYGGGHIVIGYSSHDTKVSPNPKLESDLSLYGLDAINNAICPFCDPEFHCQVSLVEHPAGLRKFPIVTVPGGHTVPIRTKKGAPNNSPFAANRYYMRQPGPRSEEIADSRGWDELLGRCLENRGEKLLTTIRRLVSSEILPSGKNSGGSSPTGGDSAATSSSETPSLVATQQVDSEKLATWTKACDARWNELTLQLPPDAPAKMSLGAYTFSYALEPTGSLPTLSLPKFLDILRASTVRHTGWPPWWVPTKEEIAPKPIGGVIECWIGRATSFPDPAHADFWRASPLGLMYLKRGFSEDSHPERLVPGSGFDITTPSWRVGEALLHAASLAKNLSMESTSVRFHLKYSGLQGRSLVSVGNPNRLLLPERHKSAQDTYEAEILVTAADIALNLPEIVQKLLSPAYELFDFFVLPSRLVEEELEKMRTHTF